MCLIALAINTHPEYPFVLAANRDEFFERPTKTLHAWPDSDIIAGQDLQQGGTWLGLTKGGRFAVVTNFRGPDENQPKPKSRGHLITQYLIASSTPEHYCEHLSSSDEEYAGYNLILGDAKTFCYHSNRRKNGAIEMTSGIHGLSNHLLNTAWPKVTDTKAALSHALSNTHNAGPTDKTTLIETLFHSLRSTKQAAKAQLPNTGIDPDREMQLSSPFVKAHDDNYGTRCSTIVLKDRMGHYCMIERSWDLSGKLIDEQQLDWYAL